MAVYTTFFLAPLEALPATFPGWKPPLSAPVQRIVRDPFTGKMETISTTEPEWPGQEDAPPPKPRVVSATGNYEAYLEERLPALIRARPHWAAKGLTPDVIGPLVQLAGLPQIETSLFGPPSASGVVQLLPPGWGGWSGDELTRLAEAWAAALSTPRHTHTASGKRVKPDLSIEESTWMLTTFASLRARGDASDRTMLLIEW